jgi:hypothetical protein
MPLPVVARSGRFDNVADSCWTSIEMDVIDGPDENAFKESRPGGVRNLQGRDKSGERC